MKKKLLALALASLPSLSQIAPALAQQQTAQQQTAAVSPDTPVNLPGLYYDPDPGPSPTFQQLTTAEQAGFVETPPLPNGVTLPYQVDRAWPQGATPDKVLKFGDLKQNPVTAGFTKLTLRDVSAQQGTDIAGVPVGDVPLVGGLTVGQVDNLYTKIGNGEKISVDDAAPAVQAALGVLEDPSQAGKQLQQSALTAGEKILITKFSKVPALKGIPLQDLANGNWEGVISKAEQIELGGIGKKIGPTLQKLPVNQIVPIVGDAINGNWEQVRKRAQAYILEKGTNVAVKEVFKAVPELKDLPLGAIPDLVNQPIEQALPKIVDLAIEEIPGAKDKLINSIPGLSEIPIDKLPFDLAFSFLAGDVFARFDIAFSGSEGKEEPSIDHALSGGSEDQKFRPIKCTIGKSKQQRADNCPHFEMRKFVSSPLAKITGDDDVEGKQWVQGDSGGKNGQGVKGGKGFLKVVNGGWEPAGIHPFSTGSHTKFLLKKITEYPNKPSTAKLNLAFQFCVTLLLAGEQCTPHFLVIPTPFTITEGGLFLVASRRNLPASIARLRNQTLAAGVYCDPNQIIASTGQSDSSSSSQNGASSDVQAQAEASGVELQPIEGGSAAPRLDGIPGQPNSVSYPGRAGGPSSSANRAGLQPIEGGSAAPRLDGIPGQPNAVSRPGQAPSSPSTPADPEHNRSQYLARIALGESSGGTDVGNKDAAVSSDGVWGIYQFRKSTSDIVKERTGVDAFRDDPQEQANAAWAWIDIYGQEVGVDIQGAIEKGDFATADQVLGKDQWVSLPGGAQESPKWRNPATLAQYGPTGDASTNAPTTVASSGVPCRPGAIASRGGPFIEGSGKSTGELVEPLSGPITSGYGTRTHPVTGAPGSWHSGIDYGIPRGTSVKASDGGIVVDVETSCVEGDGSCAGGFGNFVRIRHSNGLETVYAHLTDTPVEIGATVDQGQEIALSGNTGRSTGDHLHFEVREGAGWSGNDVNPYNYLR